MTMQEYKESQQRAAKMQELWKTDPIKARQNTINSWAPVIDRINKAIEQSKKR